MLSFGVTVLPDPPASRVVELLSLAEQNGFEYGWTYDSHILWHDPYPLLTMAALETSTLKLGLNVTNPGTREPTVTASAFATLQAISGGRMVIGIGRGDSARRTIGQKPVKVDEFERATAMIKELANGSPVRWNDYDIHLEWAQGQPKIPVYIAGYGPRVLAVAGRIADGVIIQLADPEIIEWIVGQVRTAAEEAGRDPAEIKVIACAPAHVSDDMADACEQVRWFPAMVSNHVFDLLAKHDKATPASRAHRLRRAHAAGAVRLLRAQPRRRRARRAGVRRDVRALLCPRHARPARRETAASRGRRCRPVEHLPHDLGPGRHARRLRQRHHPRAYVTVTGTRCTALFA